MNVIVTGATGFVGRALVEGLVDKGVDVAAVVRGNNKLDVFDKRIVVPSIDSRTDWTNLLEHQDVVVHCAARVHVMNDSSEDPLEAFREVNLRGTLNLAEAAAEAGVKRFIFISSIKVNGESTSDRPPFSFAESPAPEDPYGVSKAEAEEALLSLGKQSGMEIVVIRPPLVYGPGVKANFAALCHLASKRIPLPFASITSNQRSMVYIGNLVSLIVECITNAEAAYQVFLVSDNEDLSLSELIGRLRSTLNMRSLLFPVAPAVFKILGKIARREAVVDRLVGSLQVDVAHTMETLDWKPPYTVNEGLALTLKSFTNAG